MQCNLLIFFNTLNCSTHLTRELEILYTSQGERAHFVSGAENTVTSVCVCILHSQ